MSARRFDPRTVPPATLLAVASLAMLVGSLVPAPATTADVAVAGPFGVGADKWLHAAGYAVVAGLAAASRDWRRRALALVVVVVAVATFGAGIEVAQSVVPGRTASSADAVANTVGAVVGVAGWALVAHRRRRRRRGGVRSR
ncbi:VanZ family protein [Salinigranum salinum]|uniref:VanZ family protein n=1 Tax=Salinigranum salinum TaxID=1364937 RepID=UPI001F037FEC|nr:VanZ family protein [Salinigranum salinum]